MWNAEVTDLVATPPLVQGAEDCWANVSGHRMRYLRAGSGPPLLLIHGLMGYSFSWRFTIPALSRVRTVIAPDLLGTGFSDRADRIDCSAGSCSARLFGLLTQLGFDAADIVGTSHGGGVAVTMAATDPRRVRKLVLVDPVNPWSRHGRILTRLLATPFGRTSFRTLIPVIERTGKVWLGRMFGDPRRIPPDSLDGYTRPIRMSGSWEYGLKIMRCWQEDLRQLAAHYESLAEKRALIMWGDRDRAVYVSSAREVAKRMPKSTLKILAGVGHMPYEEVPDEFNRIVANFLLAPEA